VLRNWPRDCSLEDHLAVELTRLGHQVPRPVHLADEMLGIKMIRLAETEPALRTAWLMACYQTEREIQTIISDRLDRPADDLAVRLNAASAAAVMRVMDEHIGAAVLAGADLTEFKDLPTASRRLAHEIRTATGGVVGDAVAPAA
jgi:hypothetical protein